jgi:exonuclease SbcC
MEGAQKTLAGLLTELGDRQFSEEAYQQVVSTFQAVSENLTNKHREQASWKENTKPSKPSWTQERGGGTNGPPEDQGQDLATMKNLFRSSGFVNYISSVYLQELCSAATERFYKLTRQRLSLENHRRQQFPGT